ncbi:MAG: hypothetical protein ACFFED_16210 [Candidatus Thorarchaeota archaeon]
MQLQMFYTFTALPVVLLIVAVVVYYLAKKIQVSRPDLLKRFVAAVIIIGIVVPLVFVIVITLPPPIEAELDLTITYQSNSTSHEYTSSYQWIASGIYTDAYGTHLDWIETHVGASTEDTGAFAEMMYERTSGMYIQWTEIDVFSNDTWSIRIDFAFPVNWALEFRGDNTTILVVIPKITDGRIVSPFEDALESYGIGGLDVYADISLTLSPLVIRSMYANTGVNLQEDLEFNQIGIYWCTIPWDPYAF